MRGQQEQNLCENRRWEDGDGRKRASIVAVTCPTSFIELLYISHLLYIGHGAVTLAKEVGHQSSDASTVPLGCLWSSCGTSVYRTTICIPPSPPNSHTESHLVHLQHLFLHRHIPVDLIMYKTRSSG